MARALSDMKQEVLASTGIVWIIICLQQKLSGDEGRGVSPSYGYHCPQPHLQYLQGVWEHTHGAMGTQLLREGPAGVDCYPYSAGPSMERGGKSGDSRHSVGTREGLSLR